MNGFLECTVPAKPKDVLSALLHGSNYNVIMVGDQGQGTPREIMLSVRHPADPHQATAPRQNNVKLRLTTNRSKKSRTRTPPNRNIFTPGGQARGPAVPAPLPNRLWKRCSSASVSRTSSQAILRIRPTQLRYTHLDLGAQVPRPLRRRGRDPRSCWAHQY